jgi:serine/threonine-protein kinase
MAARSAAVGTMTIRRLLWLGAGVVGLLLLGILIADVFVLPAIVHSQSEVLVPELRGRTRAEAESTLHELGLAFLLGEELFSDEEQPGIVLEQTPQAMTPVRRGRPVRVVLSKGEALAVVPDLSGMSLRQAELTLQRAGLSLGRVSRSYDPRGSLGVIAQRPAAGTELQRQSSVALLLRQGLDRPQHLMPDLTGKSLVRAREDLARAGFTLRRVAYRSVRDAFPGTIVDQFPPAGDQLAAGGSVELVAAN